MSRRDAARFVFVALAAGTMSPGPALPAGPPPDPGGDLARRLARVEAILAEQREALHIPGLAFVVVQSDQVIFLKGFGLRDLERKLPVTADTLFPIGSCTKAFTALAAAVSQDEKLLSLDDSPRRFLPWFRMSDPESNELVTIRDMLSHRTGLPAYADLAAEPAVLTREEYVRAATSAKPSARFREKFQYSNAMYSAVGEVLARAHHSTWEDVIAKKIFTPLGMSSSVTSADAIAPSVEHATGYAYAGETRAWRPVPPPKTLRALAPAGNIASTARDMARWLRLMAGDGTVDGKRVVSETGLREVTTPHMRGPSSWSYCLGWATYRWNGHKVIEHNGGSQGISALMSVMPEKKIGFAFLANTSPSFMTAIGNAGKLLWPLLTGEAETVAPLPASAAAAPAAEPAREEAPVEPSLDDLLLRMVAAAGGERNIRRHTVVDVRATKKYENQGVSAEVSTRRNAPDLFSEEETWTAAGKRIATVRTYFDGTQGGQETSFGQDSAFTGEELENLRRDASLDALLDFRRLYKSAAIAKRAMVGDEVVFVIEALSAGATRDLYSVSARTFLVVQRERGGETLAFSDFRNVDGEVVPFRVVTHDALGEATTLRTSVQFNGSSPEAGLFRPRAPLR
jgi:CubicO group peptidase (beta-lactamase class C family)